ncbi:STAS domain-containing protein [Calidifontibacter sp. DB0510]|uniref:Anti-sigma factor antagonist n=1 Tax=Metallococcus carri TaxID=1656884 RepID=A0A967AYJ2_9MICO|nr:STAS domain-containing protein [Metallococcus carri]NHN55394.1 STAS domain-containing protein [Metallococcus carri]NOP36471.1 STAS domain-containing protein [Calidifontibacter sp. DB2511S]
MDLNFETSEHDGCAVLAVTGEVDVATAPRLREEILRLQDEGNVRLVLDLTGVPFIDSTGLGVLVGRLKAARAAGGDLALVVTAERLLRNLGITGLDKVFVIADSVPDAVAASKSAS